MSVGGPETDTNLRPTWLGLLAAAAVVAALQAWRYWDYVVDDIYITLRYARHLESGLGLVFNPGERVEGYTNFLHVLLAAACLRLGWPPVLVLKLIAAGAFVYTLWISGRLERRLVGNDSPPLTPLLLLPLGASVYWAVSPMETMLFAAVATTGLWWMAREADDDTWRGSALAFVLLTLVRPEGVLLFAIATLAFAVADCFARRSPRPLGRHTVNVVVYLVPAGIYMLWRLSYFGELLPNTFHARVVGGGAQVAAGVAAAREWAWALPLFAVGLLLPVALAFAGVRRRWRSPPTLAAVAFVALAHVLYIVLIGGDFMPFHRFFVLAFPALALLTAALLRALVPPSPYRPRLFLVILLVHAFWALAAEQPYRALVAHRTAVVGERVGAWLGERLRPTDVIAVNTAGALPYFSNLPAIDMLGLTEPAIAHRPVYVVSPGWTAHRRGWGEHVLQRRPRVILWYNSAGARTPHYLSDRELAASPLFRFFYRPSRERLPARDRDVIIGRFFGAPLGREGGMRLADLGMRAQTSWNLVSQTVFREGEIVADYFELEERDADLWSMAWEHRADAAALVDIAARHWAAQPQAVGDVEPAPEVRALCDEARRLTESGKHTEAKRVLADATRRNRNPRSPMVFRYVANLAALNGELFTAIAAQKEALRLAPLNPLYQSNLRSLLLVPYDDATRATTTRTSAD